MKNIILKAHAKLNLNLHLLPEKTERGYYNVRFINSMLKLHDRVSITEDKFKGIEVNIDIKYSKSAGVTEGLKGEENIAYRAAKMVVDRYRIKSGLKIDIIKNIPVKAGLGGGSSDAAAVINGLNIIFDLKMGVGEKLEIARKLGMDVCYCVIGGLCIIMGGGERVYPIQYRLPVSGSPLGKNILLALPDDTKKSTEWSYSVIDESKIGHHIDRYSGMLKAITSGEIDAICKNVWNDFTAPISGYYPVVKDIIETMKDNNAVCAEMAGSGLSVFGVFPDERSLYYSRNKLEKKGIHTLVTGLET